MLKNQVREVSEMIKLTGATIKLALVLAIAIVIVSMVTARQQHRPTHAPRIVTQIRSAIP